MCTEGKGGGGMIGELRRTKKKKMIQAAKVRRDSPRKLMTIAPSCFREIRIRQTGDLESGCYWGSG